MIAGNNVRLNIKVEMVKVYPDGRREQLPTVRQTLTKPEGFHPWRIAVAAFRRFLLRRKQ